MLRLAIAILTVAVVGAAHAQVYLGHGVLSPPRPETESSPAVFAFGQAALEFDDVLVVGAAGLLGDTGMVLFHERVAGEWVEYQRLEPPGQPDDAHFGFALARIGDDLFIGAPHTEVDGEPFAGAVHRATRDPDSGEWSLVEVIEPPAPGENGLFGQALVAVADRLYVGSPGGDGVVGGRVYAFEDDGAGSWVAVAALAGDSDLAGDAFGAAIAADAATVIVGAPGEGAGGEGAIYAFDATDLGAAPARFEDDSGTDGLTQFGRAVSVAGNRILVGADGPGADEEDAPGSAHVLELDAGALSRVATFTDADASLFGRSVLLLDEQQALVGAPLANAVYHFIEGDDGWSLAQVVAEPVQSHFTDAYFGETLARFDDRLYVGAPSALHHWGMSSGDIPLPSFSQGGKLYELPLIAPPLADLTLTTVFPATATELTEAELEITVAGDATQAVSAAFVYVRVYPEIVAMPDDCLEVDTLIFQCELGEIPAGGEATASFTVSVPAADSLRSRSLHVYAGSELADPDSSDNGDVHHLVVTAAPAPPTPAPSGGGGSFGWFGALFLLAMLKSRIRLMRSATCSARISASPVSTPNSRKPSSRKTAARKTISS